jgi:hypothetical protein
LSSNVITYEDEDTINALFVDEDEKSGKQKNETVS